MTWWDSPAARAGDRLASLADVAKAEGRDQEAQDLYRLAATHEELVLTKVPDDDTRTRGLLLTSAVSRWLKAGDGVRVRALIDETTGVDPHVVESLRVQVDGNA